MVKEPIWHDPNDCCFDTECEGCGGYIWGWAEKGEARVGDLATVHLWGEADKAQTVVVSLVKPSNKEAEKDVIGCSMPAQPYDSWNDDGED